MNQNEARRLVDSLRMGIPPDGYVRHLTVGRQAEIDDLNQRLGSEDGTALLLKANYGAGKTHLLRYIREQALEDNYAVSTVALDCHSAVRFNRMDQIFGAVCRNIEIPASKGQKGLRPFFDLIAQHVEKRKDKFLEAVSGRWQWDYSETLDSSAVFVALRSWVMAKEETSDLVEDWLYQPWEYKSQRKILYLRLVCNLRDRFWDPRSEWKFYADDVFTFDTKRHEQSWAALRDLNRLAQAAGLSGLVILFDEYEDVITNLRNIAHQEGAFWNLFHFYNGKNYPGKTFYAVTPAFIDRCKMRLMEKGKWDFDFSRLDALPTYAMSPLDTLQLEELSAKIVKIHGLAYGWKPRELPQNPPLALAVARASGLQIEDRVRHVITALVNALDQQLQDAL